MDGPGTISWEEFLGNAESFLRLSDEISDGWELRGEKSVPGRAYLYRQIRTFVPSNYLDDQSSAKNGNKKIHGEEEEEEEEEAEEEIEICDTHDPYVASCDDEQPFVTEHHILWNMSYGVPVIYFNAWFSDGDVDKVLSSHGKYRGCPPGEQILPEDDPNRLWVFFPQIYLDLCWNLVFLNPSIRSAAIGALFIRMKIDRTFRVYAYPCIFMSITVDPSRWLLVLDFNFPGVNPISVEKAQMAVSQDILSYGELSQAIHPILGTTFLQLHPCRSQELMSTMCKSKNKLVSWLSVVSPAALSLRISMKYCELTKCEEPEADRSRKSETKDKLRVKQMSNKI